MRVVKFVASTLLLFVVLPVTVVAVLGLVFSPLQTYARAAETAVVLEANDIACE